MACWRGSGFWVGWLAYPLHDGGYDFFFPGAEGALVDFFSGLLYEPSVEGKVVQGGNLGTESFFCTDEVMEVSFAVEVACVVLYCGVNGGEVCFPSAVFYVDNTFFGEEVSVASVACGHDAVEHIYA